MTRLVPLTRQRVRLADCPNPSNGRPCREIAQESGEYRLKMIIPGARPVLSYDFRLPPGPRTVEYALLAEELGFRAVWCPEIPAFGHDIWVTLARIAKRRSGSNLAPPC